MEKTLDQISAEDIAEWDDIIRKQVCAECGSHLDRYTDPGRKMMVLGCAADHSHTGFRQMTSITEDYRRGAEVHPAIRDNIEKRMLDAGDFRRALNLLAVRFPAAIKDPATASLFINDCIRLGLDPLIQPAEAVPVPFSVKGQPRPMVAMIVTEDGYLSMAARGCPEEFDGAPATMPLLDFLMKEHPKRPLADLDLMVKRTAKELCDDENAFVWVAIGKRKTGGSTNPSYGYYTQSDWRKAKANNTPAASQPGNQARVRAVKRWVRENFPEARQRMLEYTNTLAERSAGAIEAQEFIDAEYSIIIEPSTEPNGKDAVRPQKSARTPRSNKRDNKVGESAERDKPAAAGGRGGENIRPEPSGADEATSVSREERPDTKISLEAQGASNYDRFEADWLKETLVKIKWSEATARSWLRGKFNVDDSGTLEDTINRCTKAQTEQFAKELQRRADSQPSLL